MSTAHFYHVTKSSPEKRNPIRKCNRQERSQMTAEYSGMALFKPSVLLFWVIEIIFYVFLYKLTLSVSVALMSPFFHQHGHTRFRLRLLCFCSSQFCVWFDSWFAFHPSLGFCVLFGYRGFRWTLWFMCFLILPEALVSRENQTICKLCGCLCLRVHSGAFVRKQVVWSHCGAHTYLSTFCTAEGMETGVSRLHTNPYFFLALRKKKKKVHERDSVEQRMLCWTSEWHPW